MIEQLPVLARAHECAHALSKAALRGYYADQSADYRAKMVAECHRLINELIALQADLQRTVGGAA